MRAHALPLALLALSTVFVAHAPVQAATVIPREIIAAVADPSRPEADRQRDEARKPAELLAFAGINAGYRVGDILPGGGYFTRLFSKAVGPSGAVYALVPPRPANAPPDARDFAAPINAIAADPGYANVHVAALGNDVSVPEQLDLAWTSLNYHDLHNRPNADLGAFNKMVLDSLKPGGVFIVIDHAAQKGSGARDTSTLHRIDPEFVKAEVVAAGFEFVAESAVLNNPEDMHTSGVRDAGIRGKTDQFVFKFRKPKK